jgi:UDP-glucose 4-epimerase
VNESIATICGYLNLSPEKIYSGGDRGWVGDNPFILLDCTRIRALGWKPKLSIQDSIIRTVKFLSENNWVLEARDSEFINVIEDVYRISAI